MRPSSARYRRYAPETLESRVLLSAYPLHAIKAARAASHLDSHLTALHAAAQSGEDFQQLIADQHLSVDAAGRVSVTVRARNVDAVSKALTRVGFEPTAAYPKLHFVEGALPVGALGSLRGIKNVGRFAVRPSYAPISFAGAVTSQADFVMEADRVRATLPAAFNGAGQRVGVISDSFATLPGAGAAVTQAISDEDLPAGGVTVIEESPVNDTDEGRAMLELVHDLAPAASLAFATANGGEANFADNIRRLADPAEGNADVIVDDFGYFAEPMFQDGIISQAIDEVVTTHGVNYFTSAGNQASRAYESTTFTTTSQTITFPDLSTLTGAFYDFDSGAGTDHRQHFIVPAGAQVLLSFQWNDPFYTASGVDTDLNLYFIDQATNRVVSTADSDNIFFQDPVEIISYTNSTGSTKNLDLVIFRDVGPSPTRIKYVNYGGSNVTINQFATNSPTVLPHAAATQGQGVAAVPYYNQDQAESFTSKGPATILFSPAGSPIATQTRQSPQVTGIDGTNTTFFGGSDLEGDGSPNFNGTSAAAPHVAAVAALVRQANPAFTPSQVYQRLQNTADDITATGAGFDTLTGFGLVNAFDAVYPTNTPASVNFSDGFESGGVLPVSYETYSTGPGRIRPTNLGTPFAGTRHLVLDTMFGLQIPAGTDVFARNEVTLHANLTSPVGTKTLTFRQKEYDDEDHPMPANFTGSSNTDGVAFSVNGTNWFRLVSLTGTDSINAYTLKTFDLTAAAAAAGVALSADTRIRFQQYDNFPIDNADGMAFDDITITNTPPTGSIVGKTFHDFDNDGTLDGNETGIGGVTVFIDADTDGVLDPGETNTVSAGNGDYTLPNVANGTHTVREVSPTGFQATNNPRTAVVSGGVATAGINFSNRPVGALAFTGTGGTDTYLFRRAGANYEIVIGGVLAHVIPSTGVTSFTFDLAGGNDSFTVDYVGGNPVPAAGFVKYDGGATAATDNDSLTVTGSANPDTVRIHNAELPIPGAGSFDPRPIILDDLTSTSMPVESVTVNGNAGNDALTTGEALGVAVVYNGGPDSDSLNFSATAGNDTISSDFETVSDAMTTVDYPANLESVTINALGGADTLNANGGYPATFANLGDGNDTVNLNAVGAAYTVHGNGGDDVLITSSSSTATHPISFVGDSDFDSVTFNGMNGDETITLTQFSAITRQGFTGSLDVQLTESLTINANGGTDTVNAASGSSSFTTITLHGGTGNSNDTFNVTPSVFTPFRVIGGPLSTVPGDVLNIIPAGAIQSGVIVPSSEAGFQEIDYTNREPVRFKEIETLGSGIEFAPTITSLTDSPEPVTAGENLTLTATGVADANGGTLSVAFYRESNGVAGLQVGGDTSVGSDGSSPYSLTVPAPVTPGTYTYYAQASDPGGLTSDIVSTSNTVVPPVSATPGVPDLVAGSDTGFSDTDDVTRLDNGGGATQLQFEVGGTVIGATITLYATLPGGGTVVIGSAVAAGSTTTITTNGTVGLTDGISAITARQTEPGKTESVDSAALTVTVDTGVPTADFVNVTPDPQTDAVESMTITFSRAVMGFDLADLSLTRDGGANLLTGSQTLTTGDNVTFTLNYLTALTDTTGAYVLTLTAAGSGITDALAGNALEADAGDNWVHGLPAWLAASSLATWNVTTKALIVNGITTIIADPGADLPVIDASGPAAVLTIDPAADLVIHAAALNLANGATATIASLENARTAANHRVLVVNAITIDSASSLNITDNDLIVDYTSSSPAADIEVDVAGGYNVAGNWLGNGITSSVAAADGNFHVAVADNASLAAPFGSAQGGPNFAGVDVDLTSVLIKFTHRADVDLDGILTPNDSAIFGGNYSENDFANWAMGDVDYDGVFTPTDAAIFGGFYDESLQLL